MYTKGDKPREFLKNWRPISLLNVDYKILSGVLAARIKPVLCQTINADQKGFLKDRCISENCRLVFDIMVELEKRNKPGLLLLVDFQKAFDSLSWEYLKLVLKEYQFGEDFRKWFDILYFESCSTVINNGHFAEFFHLQRGCRQGDPLSPYLFLLAVEPLSMALKLDKNVTGIKIGSKEYKLGQYADDLFLLQDGTKNSLEYTFRVLYRFSVCSGLSVNVDKSHAIWLGTKANSNDTVSNRVRLKWVNNFTLLGIKFHTDLKNMISVNYRNALSKIENVFRMYKNRYLSLLGRITVIKSLAQPILTHFLQVLPSPSSKVVDELRHIMRVFLWKGGKPRLASKNLANTYEEGGLKLTDIQTFDDAIKISWIKRLVCTDGGWQSLFTECLYQDKKLIWDIDEMSLNKVIKDTKNPFWRDVFKAWKKLYYEDKNRDCRKYPIWNSFFVTNPNLLTWKKIFLERNVVYINDLLQNNGGFLSWKAFKDKYNININFLDFYSLLNSIPEGWRKQVKGKDRLVNVENCTLNCILGKKKVCAYVYSQLIRRLCNECSNVRREKWEKVLGNQLEDSEWRKAFTSLFQATVCSKLRSFQYEIVQRTLVTNKFLYLCRKLDSDKCTLCKRGSETIEHLFWECKVAKKLWDQLCHILSPYIDLYQSLSKQCVLLGANEKINQNLVNHIIIAVKRYIYVQRCMQRQISAYGALAFIKEQYRLDVREVSTSENQEVRDKWEPLQSFFKK